MSGSCKSCRYRLSEPLGPGWTSAGARAGVRLTEPPARPPEPLQVSGLSESVRLAIAKLELWLAAVARRGGSGLRVSLLQCPPGRARVTMPGPGIGTPVTWPGTLTSQSASQSLYYGTTRRHLARAAAVPRFKFKSRRPASLRLARAGRPGEPGLTQSPAAPPSKSLRRASV